jgi:hypothetical protein
MEPTQTEEKSGPTIKTRLVAALILGVAAWFLFKIVIHVVAAIALTVGVVVAIIALIWALRVLL